MDVLHEVELGLFKMVFAHLIRIIDTLGSDEMRQVNQRCDHTMPDSRTSFLIFTRYSRVPSFGSSGSGIRKFATNVTEMKKLAGRDFEDLIQARKRLYWLEYTILTNELVFNSLFRGYFPQAGRWKNFNFVVFYASLARTCEAKDTSRAYDQSTPNRNDSARKRTSDLREERLSTLQDT